MWFKNCVHSFHRLRTWIDNNSEAAFLNAVSMSTSQNLSPLTKAKPTGTIALKEKLKALGAKSVGKKDVPLEKLKPHPLKWLSANAIDLYFNDRMAAKGNEKGRRLFMCGFLKNCTFHQNGDDIYFCAMSCAEMKKTKDYEVRAHINCLQCDIMKAQCQCPAGQGFSAACKHVSALMYAIEYYAVTGSSRMFLL